VVITLDVPVGDEFAFGPDDDHGIAESVACDLRDAGYEVLGISVYGVGRRLLIAMPRSLR
jgi:hypothetical protein